jgi:hypothetical protein
MDRTQQYPNEGDPRLGEVRAVLQRLQTFSAEPDSADSHNHEYYGKQHDAKHYGTAHERAAPASDPGRPARETPRLFGGVGRVAVAVALAAVVGLAAVLGGTWLMISPAGHVDQPPVATADATPKDPDLKSASIHAPASRPALRPPSIVAIQELLKNGRVQDARQQLLGMVTAESADVAWMLARSYDPNYLAAIPAADAGPDVEQAARWYRAWHAAAVTQGMVPNSVSVERIIRSMR